VVQSISKGFTSSWSFRGSEEKRWVDKANPGGLPPSRLEDRKILQQTKKNLLSGGYTKL